jgi:hypothetical protein
MLPLSIETQAHPPPHAPHTILLSSPLTAKGNQTPTPCLETSYKRLSPSLGKRGALVQPDGRGVIRRGGAPLPHVHRCFIPVQVQTRVAVQKEFQRAQMDLISGLTQQDGIMPHLLQEQAALRQHVGGDRDANGSGEPRQTCRPDRSEQSGCEADQHALQQCAEQVKDQACNLGSLTNAIAQVALEVCCHVVCIA